MPTLELKPTHQPVQHCHTALGQIDDLGVSNAAS